MELMQLYFKSPPNTMTSVTLGIREDHMSYADSSRLMLHMRSLIHLSIDADVVIDDDMITTHHSIVGLPSVLSLDWNIGIPNWKYSSIDALPFFNSRLWRFAFKQQI